MDEKLNDLETRSMIDTEDKRITSLLEGHLTKYDALVFPDAPITVHVVDDKNRNNVTVNRHDARRASFSFSRLLHRNRLIRFFQRTLQKHNIYCYGIVVQGSGEYFKGIMRSTPLLLPHPQQRPITISEEAFLIGIAGHEVRHRVQYEFPSRQFFTPFNIANHRGLHLQVLQLLTNPEIYDATGTKLNHREFDARIIESLIQYAVHAFGPHATGIHEIITATPDTLVGVMNGIVSKNNLKG